MKTRKESDHIFSFFLLSVFLHALIISLLAFGINFYPAKLPEERIISFDILPVAKINNVKTKRNEKSEQILNENAKQINQTSIKDIQKLAPPTSPSKKPEEVSKIVKDQKIEEKIPESPPKDLVAVEEVKKKIESLKEDKSEKELDPELENQKAEKQEDEKQEAEKQEDVKPKDKQETSNANKEKVNTPTSKNKEVAKKPKPKPQEVKKKAATDKDLDSLLKNLEKNSTGNNKTKAVNRKKTEESEDAFGSFDETMPESLTNYELIKQQIMKKWNQPIASSTENIIITLRIALDIDGSVLKAEVTKILCPSGKDAVCLATRDSVRRAAIKASPLENLSQSDYDEWKELDVHFDTRR